MVKYGATSSSSSIPHWLPILLGEKKFFDPCLLHQSSKKNHDMNIFCLDCCITICPHCLPLHRPHRRLQVRRYVYQDVVRLSDAQTLINCSLVQTYTTNNAKVVFLNARPIIMSRPLPFRGSANYNFCIKCDRSLQHPFLFCSLSCKVKHLKTAMHGRKEVEQDFELTPFYLHKKKGISLVSMRRVSCRSRGSPAAGESISRRKGVPRRSPLS